MIKINLRKNKKITKNNHLGIFYAITDVYSNADRPVNDSEMVVLLKNKYGIDIERRTVKRYRDFIIDNFDICLTHEKKGYYVKKIKSELDIKVEKFEDIINQNNKLLSDEEGVYCNIKYHGIKRECIPVDINMINDEPFLLCVIENANKSLVVINIKINDIELLSPFTGKIYDSKNDFWQYIDYVDCYGSDFSLPDFFQSKTIGDVCTISVEMIMKRDVPLKIVIDEIEQLFGECIVKKVKRNNTIYKALRFRGESSEIIKYLSNNSQLYIEINERVQDVVKDMSNLICKNE